MRCTSQICVRGSFAIETEGRKERREERREEERGTYGAPVRAVSEAAGEYREYRETERRPSKRFDSLKLAAPASSREWTGSSGDGHVVDKVLTER